MVSAVGNAKWTGTPLSPILTEAGVLDKGIEVVFIGSDEGEEEVRGIKMKQNFARSTSLADAMNPNNVVGTPHSSRSTEFAWKFWSLSWAHPLTGEHAITSRAIDTAGTIQPAMDDPLIAKKHTYWESNGQVTRRIRIT